MSDRSKWGILLMRFRSRLSRVIRRDPILRRVFRDNPPPRSTLAAAYDWLRSAELPTGGLRITRNRNTAYPEVTGCSVQTLIGLGATDLATRLLSWLLCIQRADGSFTDGKGVSYVFDSAQVLRGLMASIDSQPEVSTAARRVAQWLCEQFIDRGAGGFGNRYHGAVPKTVHLHALPPIIKAAEYFDLPGMASQARRAASFYAQDESALDLSTLTHFLAYELDGLIDLGMPERARSILEQLAYRQRPDGSVPAHEHASWVCTPGLAQLAVCWYRVGMTTAANRAMAWLDRHQEASGGWLGSYGRNAVYFSDEEPFWAVKFYLDAALMRMQSPFPRLPQPVQIRLLQELLEPFAAADSALGAICASDGTPRFVILGHSTKCETGCSGCPTANPVTIIADAVIAHDPFFAQKHPASFERVCCLAGPGMCALPAMAIRDLVGATRPGGRITIAVPVQITHHEISSSVRIRDDIASALRTHCSDVAWQRLSLNQTTSGLIGDCWCLSGRRHERLSGAAWHQALDISTRRTRIIENVRANRMTEWAQQIVLATRPNETVLEIGCGTAEISLQLALSGRIVTCIDISPQTLAAVRMTAEELGLSLDLVLADASRPLPFPPRAFDCIWSAGLLEHFPRELRATMIRSWAIHVKRCLLVLVPSASCLAYRLGKARQERAGVWRYGWEEPIQSLRSEFEEAGFAEVSEQTIAARHALSFLSADDPVRIAIERWLATESPAEVESARQGYLLMTMGTRI